MVVRRGIVLCSGKYYQPFLVHEFMFLGVLQNHSRATLDLCIVFASHLMVNCMPRALKMELCVCGRQPSVRHTVCGSALKVTPYPQSQSSHPRKCLQAKTSYGTLPRLGSVWEYSANKMEI